MKKNCKKGFTLAELLIVVAIIAVLVAIAIPIFTTQLEKSREAVDAANIRAAYAEVMTEALTNDRVSCYKEVTLKQSQQKWQNAGFDFPANLLCPAASGSDSATFSSTLSSDTTIATGTANQKVYVVYIAAASGAAEYTYITPTKPSSGTEL